MMNADKNATKIERPSAFLDSRPIMKGLAEEIKSFEQSATPETVERLNRVTRMMAAAKRIPRALETCGTAAEAVFFEHERGTPRRSLTNPPRFIRATFREQF